MYRLYQQNPKNNISMLDLDSILKIVKEIYAKQMFDAKMCQIRKWKENNKKKIVNHVHYHFVVMMKKIILILINVCEKH